MATPWQPQGNCHPFEGATVESVVPAVSGVYGLHTERQQLFVGEAADLRAALLLHWEELGNMFLGRQPSQFSFEVCEAGMRAQLAQQLIAKHRPTIQALQVLSQAGQLSATPQAKSAVHGSAGAGETTAATLWRQAASAGDADAPAQSYFSRSQLAALVALSILTASALGFLGVVTGQKISARRVAAQAAARQPVPADIGAEPAPATPSADTAPGEPLSPATRVAVTSIPSPPIQVASAPSPDGDDATARAKSRVATRPAKVPQPARSEDKPPATRAATQEPSAKSWSVQIASDRDEKAAQKLQGKLKTQGYDAFIVEAVVKTARWYRVRVGRFDAKQEAEATRQMLQSKENIRGAFVTAR